MTTQKTNIVKVGKGNVKVPIQLFCPWCGHTDNYMVAKYDQPTCKKCFKNVPKVRYIKC